MQDGSALSAGLPQPGAAALAHSRRVRRAVLAEIEAAGGAIGFADYMRLVLYAPGLGYYSAGAAKFGEAGDFVTAPEISPLFGRVLARQCREVFEACGGDEVLELGAGTGALAAELLESLTRLGAAPSRYFVLEVSADLRERQRAMIADRAPAALERVEWLEDWPQRPLTGVVLANEVLDALPVERFRRVERGVERRTVVVSGSRPGDAAPERSGSLGWGAEPAPAPLAEAVAALEEALGRRLEPGYVSELSLGLGGWVRDAAAALAGGMLLFSDYGGSRRDCYSPERREGTLICHYRHRAHDDPFLLPGLQDISAWVDFSAVAEAGFAAGLELAGYTTQAQFLLAGGLERELGSFAALPDRERLALSAQVKLLTLPAEMGERVKFMGFVRDPDGRARSRAASRLSGFGGRDLRDRL